MARRVPLELGSAPRPYRVVTIRNATDLLDTLGLKDGERVAVRIEGVAIVGEPMKRTSGEWAVDVVIDVDHGETIERL